MSGDAFVPRACPSCGVLYKLAALDVAARETAGRSHYCPNGHEVQPDSKGEAFNLRWQLEQALGGWEDDREQLLAEVEHARGLLPLEVKLEPVRRCLACGKPLWRRPQEKRFYFRKRVTCDTKCAAAYRSRRDTP